MNLLKKISISIMSLAIVGVCLSPSVVKASENLSAEELQKSQGITLNINSSDVEVSEVMTYDELVNKIAIEENLPVEEVKTSILPEKTKMTRSNLQARAGTYRTFSYSLPVTSGYRPSVQFYCETSEWGNWHGIARIARVSMNRGYNGMSKIFNGDVYVNLERADTIYFEVNGDFYNNGSVTVGVGVDVPVGSSTTAKFSASYTSSHYAYIYKVDRLVW